MICLIVCCFKFDYVTYFIVSQFSHSNSIRLKKQENPNEEAFGGKHMAVESMLKVQISKVVILSYTGKLQKWLRP